MRLDRGNRFDHLGRIEPDMRIAIAQIVGVIAVIDHLVDHDQFDVVGEDEFGNSTILDGASPTARFDERFEVGARRQG